MHLTVRYVPRRLVPALAASLALALVALAGAAAAGVVVGWFVGAILLWYAAVTLRRIRRAAPALTVDAAGLHEHRLGIAVGWDEVESVRTVDRRSLLHRIPLLELVPRERFARDGRRLVLAVLRGDIAVVDARDDRRLMVDLQHLDATPEEVLAAVREGRAAAA